MLDRLDGAIPGIDEKARAHKRERRIARVQKSPECCASLPASQS